MKKENYRIFNVMKSGEVIEGCVSLKVPVNEETKVFYDLIASATKTGTSKDKTAV